MAVAFHIFAEVITRQYFGICVKSQNTAHDKNSHFLFFYYFILQRIFILSKYNPSTTQK
jgi:hypothetical protein